MSNKKKKEKSTVPSLMADYVGMGCKVDLLSRVADLSEIIWASKPDCGIPTTRKASPNLRPPGPRTEQRTEQR